PSNCMSEYTLASYPPEMLLIRGKSSHVKARSPQRILRLTSVFLASAKMIKQANARHEMSMWYLDFKRNGAWGCFCFKNQVRDIGEDEYGYYIIDIYTNGSEVYIYIIIAVNLIAPNT